MSAIDVESDANTGLRTGQGVAPPAPTPAPTDGGEAIWGAAFRQSNSVVSALQYMRNSGPFTPQPDYNPVTDIKGWNEPRYFLDHGDKFVGSQSPAETQAIKSQIDAEENDKRTLAANGTIGYIAQMGAGSLDPTLLLPGGVAVDAAKGGLSFAKAAVQVGKAALLQTTAQEALLQGTQQTREWSESALNVASGTLLTALIGGGAASLLSRGERAGIEARLHADRADINTHAENPSTGEAPPKGEVFTDAYDRLRAIGMDEAEARANASVVAARYETRAQRLGGDAEQLYRGENIDVKGADWVAEATPETTRSFRQVLETWDGGSATEYKAAFRIAEQVADEEGFILVGASGMSSSVYLRRKGSDRILRLADHPNYHPGRHDEIVEARLSSGKERIVKRFKDDDGQLIEDVDHETVIHQSPDEIRAIIKRAIEEYDTRTFSQKGDPTRANDFDGRRMTRKQAARELIGRYDQLAETDNKPHVQSMIDSLEATLQKFDAPAGRGKPFQRSKVLEAGDDFAVRVVTDERHGADDARKVFRIYRRPDGDLETLQQPSKQMGSPLGYVEMSQHHDGRWEVDMVEVAKRHRRQGVTTALYDAVEREVGTEMSPSGMLLPNGYAFWKSRAPEKVQWHTRVDHAYYSPRRLKEMASGGNLFTDEKEFARAFDALPAEAKSEAAMRNMFQGEQGRISLAENGALVQLFEKADASTFMHESSHLWLDELVRDAARADAPQQIKDDLAKAMQWLGADDPAKLTTAHHEQWARGFEEYLRDGRAPSAALARVFEQFKQWLTTIYRSLADFGPDHVAISDDVRGVMDRMLATDEQIGAAGQPPALGTAAPASVGAAASDTRKLELVPFGLNQIPGVARVVGKTSPMQRVFGADSPTARRAGADLAETSLLFKENLEGKSTVFGGGPALDREARLMIHQGQVATGDALSQLFSDYRFGEQKFAPRARALFESATGKADGKMSFDEFKEAVSDAMRNGDRHEIPQVEQAAQVVRQKVFEPWKERAIKAGLLPEDVGVKTADSYVSRLYNKQAIAAKRPDFVNRVADWLQADQQAKAEAQTRIQGLSKKLADAETNIEYFTKQLAKTKDDDLLRDGFESDLSRAIDNQAAARKQLEKEIAAWEGKSAAEAKAALKAREKAEADRASDAKRLKSADKIVDRAVKRILESDRDLPRQELQSRAQEITDRIIGAPDGRLPYDLGMEHGTAFGGSGEAPRGALAAREFNIPDATIRDFLENDIEHIIATHLRTMVPDVLLTEKFGDTRMTETFRKINDDYAALVDAAKSEKERSRLEKERQGVIDDLAAIRDRIRGTYGISSTLPMRNTARAVNMLKNYNVLTSMGSAALSSLPDMAGSVMRHGLTSTFSDAWSPFFQFLTRQSDAWQEAGRQYRAMGIAVESVLASRHHALTDTLDTYHPQSRVERTMQWATGKFQFVNMLAPWTDFAKINASMVAGSEILRAAKAAAEGKASARQLRSLGESGIEPHMAARIAKAFETGGEIRDGVHLPNTADWADLEARRVFEGAVARDADIAVVTPGQEKPLWMSHPILSVIGQFKSFTAAGTERILISNLQRRDAQVLQGMLFSMGLGMLSYRINSLTGGQPVSDKPQDWIKEAISRGNLLGWFEEGNALASKATRGGVDIYRMIGADKPLSRYASRSAMDQILGPTAGKIGGIIQGVQALSHPSEWNESDSKAIRRLVAGQNVFYIRRLFDQVEASGNNAFGIEMKAKPENR